MQKRWSWSSALTLGLAVGGLVSVARAEEKKAKTVDPSGTYTWERTRGDRTFKRALKLEFRGHTLTGTYKGRRDPVKLEEVKLEGNKISFQYTRSFNDRDFTIKYQGILTESGIKGTVEFPSRDGGRTSRPWEAKRGVDVSDVLGLWKLKFAGRDAETIETSIKVSKDGDKLTGLYTSPRRERQAQNVTLKDGELSFEIKGETEEGTSYFVTYRGKPRGNSIKGTLTFKFGDNEGTREFVGEREAKKRPRIADVIGTWTLEVTRDNGETRKSSISITLDGDKLKGRYTSRYGEREAKKLQLNGDVLSFELSGDTDRGSFLVVYKGKLSGDSIKGTSTFEFGDRKGTRSFVGRREKKAEPPGEGDKKP
ncbi:MAG: hypothetical protein O7J95_10810 [Planctomycetota bacterium]|nr:hypothetical protein [Planctomycetota bacterium]